MQRPNHLPESTYASDPKITHVVETAGEPCGYGVYGWYTCEFAAMRVAAYWRKEGCRAVLRTLEDYRATRTTSVHPYVTAHRHGFI